MISFRQFILESDNPEKTGISSTLSEARALPHDDETIAKVFKSLEHPDSSITTVAKDHGIKRETLRSIIKRHKHKFNYEPKPKGGRFFERPNRSEALKKVAERFREGKRISHMGRQLGPGRFTLKKPAPKENHTTLEISRDEKIQLYGMRKQGLSHRELSAKSGYDRQALRRHLDDEDYPHVKELKASGHYVPPNPTDTSNKDKNKYQLAAHQIRRAYQMRSLGHHDADISRAILGHKSPRMTQILDSDDPEHKEKFAKFYKSRTFGRRINKKKPQETQDNG